MAATAINIYMDKNAELFVDPERRTPFPGPLFQKAQDVKTNYTNADCTIVATLVTAEDSQTTTESCKEDAATPSPSCAPALPANEGFSKTQTLFLIDLMRQHLENEASGLPKTLKELNSRLKNVRVKKKYLWKETAEKLSCHFSEVFCPDKVARKWNTLIEAYKKIKENNRGTLQGPIRFQFYVEMDELLGGQHNIVFPVVGTAARHTVKRQTVLGASGAMAPLADASPCSSTHASPTSCSTPARPRKRRRFADDVLQFLHESEEASQRRHEEAQRRHQELLAQLKSAQQGFESLMSRLLDKL
ncbi:uncharacterized protein LOC141810222 [Halichoeres trimaculatus]|uniref:uncharacterized protein LOC141810222 n=1 Tax=Halichoeres trimaculatus TaxID=147232 RepID=UPI003D9EE82D